MAGGRAAGRPLAHLPRPPEGPPLLSGAARAFATSPAAWGSAASGTDAGGDGLRPALPPPGRCRSRSHGGGVRLWSARSTLGFRSAAFPGLGRLFARRRKGGSRRQPAPAAAGASGVQSPAAEEGGRLHRSPGRAGRRRSGKAAAAAGLWPAESRLRPARPPVNRLVRFGTKLGAARGERECGELPALRRRQLQHLFGACAGYQRRETCPCSWTRRARICVAEPHCFLAPRAGRSLRGL